MMINCKKVIQSFPHAFAGIFTGLQERNMKVHLVATIVVLSLSVWLKLSLYEWWTVLILIVSVWAAELVNTAVEELSNIVRDELKLNYHSTKRARDLAAGAVLMFAMVAAFIGGMIFVPKILMILGLN